MIIIDDIYISDEVVEEHFVCDLQKCKGGCCIEGDAGAPLTKEEMEEVTKALNVVTPMISAEGRKVIEQEGKYVYDREFGWVTPVLQSGMCVYGIKEEHGIVKCAFEQAYNDGKIGWKKPISCHLFPIKITKSKHSNHEYVNYEPREQLCKPACELGSRLKIPVYVFLKEALTRKYGNEFYETLDQIARQHYLEKKNKQ